MARLYRRHGYYYISFWDPVERRQVRKTLHTKKKSEADLELLAYQAEIASRRHRAPQDLNPDVDAFWEKYEAWAQRHKRPSSIERSKAAWKHLTEFIAPRRLGDVRRSDIERLKTHLLDIPLKHESINGYLRDLQAIFNRAINERWYTGVNPVQGVERFKISRTMPKYHNEAEREALLTAARKQGQYIEWIVLLGAYAGLRKAEIVNARWEWFNFDEAQPTIDVKAFPGFTLKDREDRTIPMSKVIFDTLLPHRQDEGFLFEASGYGQGRNRYRFEPKKALIAALTAAGLDTDDPFQRLRHSFGSALAQKGVSLYKIARWMGHSSVNVTAAHYAALQGYDEEINRL